MQQAQRDRSVREEGDTAEVDSSAVRSDAARSDGAKPEAQSSEVQVSGVRTKKGAASSPIDEETALARLLFGWGVAATVFGLIIGGLWFEPLGAVVGALSGSVIGVFTVVAVVLVRRGLSARNR